MDTTRTRWNDDRFDEFANRIDERFDRADERTDQRFDLVDQRFDRVDERFDRVDERFGRVEERFDWVDRRLDQIDERQTHEFIRLNDRLDDLVKVMIAGVLTLTGAILAGFISIFALVMTQL